MALTAALRAELEAMTRQHRVVLFMKGTRARPQCGFSASVVEILDELLDDYATVDVLARPEVREGIKEYSDWPTIPQLYVAGEFVGGADILRELRETGELEEILGATVDGQGEPPHSPLVDDGAAPLQVTVTAGAIAAMLAARQEDDGSFLRLEISPEFEHGLFFDDKKPGDRTVACDGVTLVVDAESAARADHIRIDYVKEGEREGFKIDNPNRNKPAKPAAAAPPPRPPRPENPPAFEVTADALAQFRAAVEEEGDGDHAIKVGARRMGAKKADYELGIIKVEEKGETDFVIERDGLCYFVDENSARTLDGATIDFVSADGGSGFKFSNARLEAGWTDERAIQLQDLLEKEINPGVAAHGGYVELLDLIGDIAYVLMGGGCQGCGMAAVTLQQGIQERVAKAMPGLRLIDTTDHAAGANPYYRAKH
ncbi:MAG: Grx4 family monothiol glutaredoxin [Myxococcota bacterium]